MNRGISKQQIVDMSGEAIRLGWEKNDFWKHEKQL